MADATYKVVTRGVTEGLDHDEVAENLVKLFKKSRQGVDVFIQNRSVVVKKGLDRKAASAYKTAINKAGLNCELVEEKPAAAEVKRTQPSVPESVAAKKKRIAKDIEKMVCPKCDFEQPQSPECVRCGVIIEKAIKTQSDAEGQAQGISSPPQAAAGSQPPQLPRSDDMEREKFIGMGLIYDEEYRDPVNFMAELPTVFAYPFQGNGLFILGTGAVFIALISFLSRFSMMGGLFQFFLSGYISAYMVSVIVSSGEGDKEPPNWPGISSLGDDIVLPFFRVVACSLFCYAPAFLYFLFTAFSGSTNPLLVLVLIFLGSLYYPMALMAVAMSGRFTALLPFIVIPSILKAPAQYMIALVAFFVILVINGVLQALVTPRIPFIGILVQAAMTIYFLMVEMRILGLLYNANEENFSWFGD